MPFSKIGPINPVHVLVKQLRQDDALKQEAIEHLRHDLYGFVETVFDLTPEQSEEMRRKMPQAMSESVAHACIVALETNGPIEFEIVYDRRVREKPNMRMEVYCRGGGGGIECGVRITWEK